MAGLRIEAVPPGGGQGFVLADGLNARGPGGKMAVDATAGGLFAIRFDAIVQETFLLRGTQSKRFDRGNQSGSVPCAVEYEFTTAGACFAFLMDLQASVPIVADLVFSLGGVSRTLANVALRPLEAQFIGEVACRVTYPIRFGLVAQPQNT